MTNEVAKQWILDHMAPDDDTKQSQAMRVVIKALEQEPCEDAISRQAVIDVLTKTSGIRGDALKALYDLPPVTPQQKTGHWIKIGAYQGKCSCCNNCVIDEDENFGDYCRHCGSDMRGDE